MTQTNQLAVSDQQSRSLALQVFGQERLDIIREQIGRGWKQPPTDAELAFIATVCDRTRLDVLAKPPLIYFIKRWDSKLERDVMTPQVSVDGLRLIASRSRDYIGPGGQQWCGEDGVWKDVWLSDVPPRAARVGVLKRGHREPLWSVALWDEWAQWQDEWRQGKKTGGKVLAPFWASKPAHMLAKTAEAMSLKRAFPAETNDLELAHLEELHRLEVPARAAEYDRIYGADEEHAFAELPMGAGAPNYTPQPALNAAGDVVDTTSGEVLVERPVPPSPPTESTPAAAVEKNPRRTEMLEMYGTLLAQARRDNLIADAAPWVLRSDVSEVEIISRGRELRALVNKAQMDRAAAAAPAAEPDTGASETLDPKTVTTIDDPLYLAYAEKVKEAIELGLEYQDLELPMTVKDVTKLGKQLQSTINAARHDADQAALV